MSALTLPLAVLAYLLGSVSSAIVVCRLLGLPDPRQFGSGNPGATNVLRVGGKKAAAITLFGDMLKGLLPVLLGHWAGVGYAALGLIGLAAFFGHLYPLYFGFRGGKGVATGLGVLLGLAWPAGLLSIATWLVVAKLSRISSLAALAAMLLAPLYIWWFTADPALSGAIALMSAVLVWRHRSNIEKLLQGTEPRIGAGQRRASGEVDAGDRGESS